MRCVSPHVSPQVVEKFCPLVWEMGKRTWACAGVACPALPPAYSAFSFLLYPLSPRPPSPPGKGETQSLFRLGLRPRHPGVEPAVTAKPTEFLYLEQCRQPRRGGTGGDGTIRRTRRRRLRWSSPPGQVEQMPHGERSPAPRRAAPEQGAYRALAEGLALPRLLASPPLSPAGGLPPRFSFHALTGAAGCDILVYRTEPPRRTARKQKETPYRTAIPERRKGENRA